MTDRQEWIEGLGYVSPERARAERRARDERHEVAALRWDDEPTAAEYDSGDVVGMADEDRYGSAQYWETHTVAEYLAERYGLGRGR